MKTKAEAINALLDRFPFGAVRAFMVATEWAWNDQGVPSVGQLRERAEDLLRSVSPGRYTSTGGFSVGWGDDGDLTLEFVIDEVEYEVDRRVWDRS